MDRNIPSNPTITSTSNARKTLLNIAYCVPELHSLDVKDSSFMQQARIFRGLKDLGHRVTMFAPKDLSDVEQTADLSNRSDLQRTWSRSAGFQLVRKASWLVQKQLGIPYLNYFSNFSWQDAFQGGLSGFDMVQERNGLYKYAAAMAARRLKIPYVLFFDADDLFEHDYLGIPLKGVLRKRAQETAAYNLRTASRIICVSQETGNRLVKVWGVPEEKIYVHPNGVDVNLHRPYPETRVEVRASYGYRDEPLLIFVGGFFPWHDVEGLLNAFQRTLIKHPDARLLLVGDGQRRQTMEQYAMELGISDCVKFTGWVPHSDVPRLISAADIAVAPYPKMSQGDFWGSPMKLFEYLACGTAVAASGAGQISEVIRHDQNGLLALPGNAESLSEVLSRLIADRDLRSRLGIQARKDAVEKYSWESYVAGLERLYFQVIDEQERNR